MRDIELSISNQTHKYSMYRKMQIDSEFFNKSCLLEIHGNWSILYNHDASTDSYWDKLSIKVGRLLIDKFAWLSGLDMIVSDGLMIDKIPIDDINSKRRLQLVSGNKNKLYKSRYSIRIYLLMMLHLLIYILLQLCYNADSYKLKKLNEIANNPHSTSVRKSLAVHSLDKIVNVQYPRLENGRPNISKELYNELSRKYESNIIFYEKILSSFGAPYLNADGSIVLDLIFLDCVVIIIIFQTYFHHTRICPLDYSVINTILYRQKFIKYNLFLVVTEMKTYLDSSRNYVFMKMDYLNVTDHGKNYNEYYFIVKRIYEMLANGSLIPLNRGHQQVNKYSYTFNILATTSFIGVMASMLNYWGTVCNYQICRFDLMSLLVWCDIIGLTSAICFGIGFYFTSILIVVKDSNRYLLLLIKTVESCIIENERIFYTQYKHLIHSINCKPLVEDDIDMVIEQNGLNHSEEYHCKNSAFYQMNSNLLYIILQYKIFIEQIKKSRPAIEISSRICLTVSLTSPMLILFTSPFVDERRKTLVVASFISYIMMNDGFIIPICYINSRWHELNRKLYSLMAHVETVKAFDKNIYNDNIVVSFNKEVTSAEARIEENLVKTFGIVINYNSFVKYHLYLIILLTYTHLAFM